MISFADIAVKRSLEHNHSVKMMERINKAVTWETIEALLLEYYDVGKSTEVADAYPPLMLLKCLLLQKCLRPVEKNSRNGFHIQSDPELETQINDRTSFKTFLNLSLDESSPDHSTFSRFRSRLSKAAGLESPLARKEAMIQLNNEILLQFAHKGFSINEGIAVDARLASSSESLPLGENNAERYNHCQTDAD